MEAPRKLKQKSSKHAVKTSASDLPLSEEWALKAVPPKMVLSYTSSENLSGHFFLLHYESLGGLDARRVVTFSKIATDSQVFQMWTKFPF